MTDEQNKIEVTGTSDPANNGTFEVVDAPEMEFKTSPEVQAAADEALGNIKDRSFSGRNVELGKMINCQVCRRRHRVVDAAYREHIDDKGKKTVTLDPLVRGCKQTFKQLWVDEDLETGELSIQYATVPLPGQIKEGKKPGPKPIFGAAMFAKKRKNRHPNKTGLQIVELTRSLMKYVNKELHTEEQSQMLEARRFAVNTLRNKREKDAKKKRIQQRESRRTNRR